MERRFAVLLVLLVACGSLARAITFSEKALYKNKVLEMFFHAYHSYMDHAYPADELMPLTCKGRVRGQDRNRGDIDDALGMFSLTLVDSLDTLAVLGQVDEFNKAIKAVVRDVTFDRDVVVSVFETNIRILGGLLGGHFAAEALKEKGYYQLSWYNGHLLRKAKEIGERLLPAFNTTTGLPYPKVNLRYGMGYRNSDNTTCTACAGTMLMEFAALSRLTGDPKFEVTAHRAMEVLWQNRHQRHNLVGTIINVHNGQWLRQDSGVGAGSDSYYEYCLKSYILLGDQEYLNRFELHYRSIMKYISNGPMLVDVSMNSPTRMTRSYMDSLLAFWPGLQVLWGDVEAAIHTHDMLYHVTERHNFLPEAFTLDFRVHWGNHPLRPEFSESTYFLYKATGDPYYLDVGKTIVDNLNEYARVFCGFAAIKDLRNNEHEDRMDSFVLAETFKYLYLLFAEEEDLPLDMDDFLFTTEAHILPLSLASFNATLNQVVRDARVIMNSDSPQSGPPATKQSDPAPSPDEQAKPTATPITGPPPSATSNQCSAPATPPSQATPHTVPPPSLTVQQLQCPNEHRPFVLQDEFEKLVLKQCTSSRFRIRPNKIPSKRVTPPRLDVNSIDFSNREHIAILGELGIVVESLGGGKVQVSHLMQKAKTPEDAEEGWFLMQDIMKLMTEQQKTQETALKRHTNIVQIMYPPVPATEAEFEVGPALFGPELGVGVADLAGQLYMLPGEEEGGAWGDVKMGTGCQSFVNLAGECLEKVVLMSRGGCLFIQKVRNAQNAGAIAAIIADNVEPSNNPAKPLPFSMSGDGIEDVTIPSVFMRRKDTLTLLHLLESSGEVVVKLAPGPEDSGANEGEEGKEESLTKEGGEKKHINKLDNLEQLQGLLEGLHPSILSDELKTAVEEQVQKLRLANSGSTATTKEEDAVLLTQQIKDSVEEQLKVLSSDSGVEEEELRRSVAKKLQEVMDSETCSADRVKDTLGGEEATTEVEDNISPEHEVDISELGDDAGPLCSADSASHLLEEGGDSVSVSSKKDPS